MKHIRQINSVNTNTYTIVLLDNYDGQMEEHPIFNAFQDAFEISENDLPDFVQYVSFEIEELNKIITNRQ
jgi:cell fate (sporulation/competence/biofilm development) regulator YmcA (YheA/YmcA/DUF963 family)